MQLPGCVELMTASDDAIKMNILIGVALAREQDTLPWAFLAWVLYDMERDRRKNAQGFHKDRYDQVLHRTEKWLYKNEAVHIPRLIELGYDVEQWGARDFRVCFPSLKRKGELIVMCTSEEGILI